MNGKVHVAIGTATAIGLCVACPKGVDFCGMHMLPEIMIVSVAAGSYAPDIDNPRTHAGMKHKTASKIINKVEVTEVLHILYYFQLSLEFCVSS